MAQGVWVKVFPPPPVVKPELPGLGGWADVTAVTGSPTKHEYTDADGNDWTAYEWIADGSVTTTEGLVDSLIVGGGARGATGTGGGVIDSLAYLKNGVSTVSIGAGGAGTPPVANWTIFGKPSAITGPHGTIASGAGIHLGDTPPTVGGAYDGPHMSDITGGAARAYSGQEGRAQVRFEAGSGAASAGLNIGQGGCVIVRVPRANAKA